MAAIRAQTVLIMRLGRVVDREARAEPRTPRQSSSLSGFRLRL
jgi:hypothetical protein